MGRCYGLDGIAARIRKSWGRGLVVGIRPANCAIGSVKGYRADTGLVAVMRQHLLRVVTPYHGYAETCSGCIIPIVCHTRCMAIGRTPDANQDVSKLIGA